MMHNYVVTECYADKILIEFLNFQTIPVHSGIGEVINVVINNQHKVGLIDKDKREIKGQFNKFILDKNYKTIGIELFSYEEQYIIRISPALEKWLWDEAEKLKVKQIRNSFEEFKKFTKTTKIEHNLSHKNLFKSYLNTLYQKKSKKLIQLQTIISKIIQIS